MKIRWRWTKCKADPSREDAYNSNYPDWYDWEKINGSHIFEDWLVKVSGIWEECYWEIKDE